MPNSPTITKFNNSEKIISNHYVGKKWGEIWGFVTEGLFQSPEEVSAHADQSEIYGGGWYPGDVKFKDLNGDNKINYGKGTLDDPGDRKVIGNSEPRYAYGIKINAEWKNFDLNIFFQGIGKRDVELGGNQFWGFGNEWHVFDIYDLETLGLNSYPLQKSFSFGVTVTI